LSWRDYRQSRALAQGLVKNILTFRRSSKA
jgi:hypothetical protein